MDSSVQSLSCVRLFATSWTAARQASLSFTNAWSLLKLMSIQSVMPSNHLILCRPFSCLQSFPASGSFPMSQFFSSGGQSIGASALASVIPMNIQDLDTIWATKQNNRDSFLRIHVWQPPISPTHFFPPSLTSAENR